MPFLYNSVSVLPTSTRLIISVPLILISLSITNGTMKKLVQTIPNQLYCKYPRFSRRIQILWQNWTHRVSNQCYSTGPISTQLWAMSKSFILTDINNSHLSNLWSNLSPTHSMWLGKDTSKTGDMIYKPWKVGLLYFKSSSWTTGNIAFSLVLPLAGHH